MEGDAGCRNGATGRVRWGREKPVQGSMIQVATVAPRAQICQAPLQSIQKASQSCLSPPIPHLWRVVWDGDADSPKLYMHEVPMSSVVTPTSRQRFNMSLSKVRQLWLISRGQEARELESGVSAAFWAPKSICHLYQLPLGNALIIHPSVLPAPGRIAYSE